MKVCSYQTLAGVNFFRGIERFLLLDYNSPALGWNNTITIGLTRENDVLSGLLKGGNPPFQDKRCESGSLLLFEISHF